MKSFCILLGLLNFSICTLCFIWFGADRSNGGAPAIVGVLSLNMAMGWLWIGGLHRDETGGRAWSGRPAMEGIVIFVILIIGAFLSGR